MEKFNVSEYSDTFLPNEIYNQMFPHGLDGSGVRKWLETNGVECIKNYDVGTNGWVETADGFKISTNGYVCPIN